MSAVGDKMGPSERRLNDSQIPYRTLLSILTALFAFRVLMQPLVWKWPIKMLPSFDQWHSEAMPYGVLLFLQLIILGLMILGCFKIPNLGTNQIVSRILLALGWLYAVAMVSRLIIGLFELSPKLWFKGAVPTAFHFVLLSYIMILSYVLSEKKSKKIRFSLSRYFGYPVLIVGTYLHFVWMKNTGTPLLFASYLSVLIGILGVVLHESFNPIRNEWRPEPKDLIPDGMFLIIVQLGIPALLKLLLPAAIIAIAGSSVFSSFDYWPHHWPLLAQIALMLLVAEFFRYWIHRLMHEFGPLWKLHAVHHASDKLYTINVGRFHPLDKAIQFLGDSLPFLLLGVQPEVFAAYFVFYAVNGFYQHSNADIRLGFLNWIVAGPELHRWHHSTVIAESNANYGNNLIVWDVIFGTRQLPKERTVSEVGIGNKKWPRGFFSQLIAPLTQSTDHEPDK